MTDEMLKRFIDLCNKLHIDEKYAEEEAKKRFYIHPDSPFSDISNEQVQPILLSLEKALAVEEYKKTLQEKIQGMLLDCGCEKGKICANPELNEHNKTIREVLSLIENV